MIDWCADTDGQTPFTKLLYATGFPASVRSGEGPMVGGTWGLSAAKLRHLNVEYHLQYVANPDQDHRAMDEIFNGTISAEMTLADGNGLVARYDPGEDGGGYLLVFNNGKADVYRIDAEPENWVRLVSMDLVDHWRGGDSLDLGALHQVSLTVSGLAYGVEIDGQLLGWELYIGEQLSGDLNSEEHLVVVDSKVPYRLQAGNMGVVSLSEGTVWGEIAVFGSVEDCKLEQVCAPGYYEVLAPSYVNDRLCVLGQPD